MCISVSYCVHGFLPNEVHLYQELIKAAVVHAASLSTTDSIPLRAIIPDAPEPVFINTLHDVSLPLILKSHLFNELHGRIYDIVVTRISPPCEDDLVPTGPHP